MKTLKQICDSVSKLARFDTESSYINSTDPDHHYLPELANDVVAELLTEDWTELKKDGQFFILGGSIYQLPDDFDHFITDTINTDNIYRQVTFPVTDLEWRFLESNNYEISYYGRLIANPATNKIQVEFDGSVPDGTVIKYSYRTKRPIISHLTGNFVDEFTNDNDQWTLDNRLLIKLLHANWVQALGFDDWQLSAQKAQMYKQKLLSNQKVSRTMQTYGNQELPPEVLGY
ncbi:MAG: hypothetical protein L3J83_03705 [Proteobacteria bacterium]|nr:hypothetical protein [Pseudomonadota bacterium]